jgi:hypothetical protein
MTSDADPHEEFEIAALRRARGALDEEGVARLDAHLGTCAACSGFAATAAATTDALRGRVRRSSASRDWTRIRSGLDARAKELRRRLIPPLVVDCVLVAIVWPLKGPGYAALLAGIAALGLAGLFVFWILPRQRAARRAARSDTALLKYYRADLDREIRAFQSAKVCAFLVGAVWLYLAGSFIATAQNAWRAGRPYDVTDNVIMLLGNAGAMALMAYQGWVLLPRLERERKDLK